MIKKYISLFKNFNFSNKSLTFLFLSIITSLLALTPIFKVEGWLISHEGLSWIGRTNTYYESIRNFNFFPIWSTMDYYSAGAPSPLFYNKLFYYIAAAFRFFFLNENFNNPIYLNFNGFRFRWDL